jgi:hypothetical protein
VISLDELIPRYISAWNEPDDAVRLATLTECWTADAVLVDPFDDTPASGPEEISASIGKAFRERIPAGCRFVLTSEIERHHSIFRYAFALVDEDGRRLREGIDTGRVAPDGRLAMILTFLGLQPPIS